MTDPMNRTAGFPGPAVPPGICAPPVAQVPGTPSPDPGGCNTGSRVPIFPAAGTPVPAKAPVPGAGASPASGTGLQAIAAAMSEAELEENIRDACKKLGILRFHVRMSKGTTAGLPDDILIGPRGILWRECKNQTYKPTPAQVKTGAALTAIGQDFDLWRPVDWMSGRIKSELLAISGQRVKAGAA